MVESGNAGFHAKRSQSHAFKIGCARLRIKINFTGGSRSADSSGPSVHGV